MNRKTFLKALFAISATPLSSVASIFKKAPLTEISKQWWIRIELRRASDVRVGMQFDLGQAQNFWIVTAVSSSNGKIVAQKGSKTLICDFDAAKHWWIRALEFKAPERQQELWLWRRTTGDWDKF